MHAIVVGDVGVDKTRMGFPERLSPECRHTPVMRQIDKFATPAMAANVARNLRAQGIEVTLYGAVGRDEDGCKLSTMLEENSDGGSIFATFLECSCTTVKHRVVDEQGRLISRTDVETNLNSAVSYDPEELSRKRFMLDGIKREMDRTNVLVLSDYGKGFLSDWFYHELLQAAEDRGLPVLIDPKGDDWLKYHGGSRVYLTPNLIELRRHVGLADTPDRLGAPCLSELSRQILDADWPTDSGMVVTLGEYGMYLHTSSVCSYQEAYKRLKVFDPVGAGDVVLAVLAYSLASYHAKGGLLDFDAAIKRALKPASVAGYLACRQPGSVCVSRGEISKELRDAGLVPRDRWWRAFTNPWAAADWLQSRVDRAYQQVVFTNGCFDILHSGHLHLFFGIKRKFPDCLLVVGVNSDDAVKRLKGKGRPVNTFTERVPVVAALEQVDLVVGFNEMNAVNVMEQIQPEVYCKAAGDLGAAAPEREWANRNGVEIIEIRKNDSSTSQVVRRIRGQ